MRRRKLVINLAEISDGGYQIRLGARSIGYAGFRPCGPGGSNNAWYQFDNALAVAVTCVRFAELKKIIGDALRQEN